MLSSIQQEWERPDPTIEPDPGDVIIPRVPFDDDNSPDPEETDQEDDDEESRN